MSAETNTRENDGRVLDQMLRTIYAHHASIDDLDPDGAVRLFGANDATIFADEDGYGIVLSGGSESMSVPIDDNVSITFGGCLTLRFTPEGPAFTDLPESLTDIEDFLLPFFVSYVRKRNEDLMPEQMHTNAEDGQRFFDDVAVDVAAARAFGFRGNFELAEKPLADIKRKEQADNFEIWGEVTALLEVEHDDEDLTSLPLESVWLETEEPREAVGLLECEKLGSGDQVIHLAIATEYGFYVKFEDDTDAVFGSLELIIEPEKIHLLDENGYEELPKGLLKPVYEFLRRAEVVEEY